MAMVLFAKFTPKPYIYNNQPLFSILFFDKK